MAHSGDCCIVEIDVFNKGSFVGNFGSEINMHSPHLVSRFKEDSEKGHWYPDVLKNPTTDSFLDKVTSDKVLSLELRPEFTLTVTAPHESGSLRGWRVHQLEIPGR
jgi:hypothetical protein